MKKTFIAAAVPLALAAVPVVSSFAASGAVTDNFSLSIIDSCFFDRTSGDGDYAVSVNPGTYSVNFASSVFTVACNTPDTYTVTAVFTDLTNGNSDSINYSIYDPDGTQSAWTAKVGDILPNAVNVVNGSTILNATVADGGATATVRYSVGAASNQAAGTYTGTATYTLVSGN